VIVGDYAFRCHEDREIGFRAYLRTAFPEVVLADVESIKNRVLKPYFGLGSGLNDPGFQGLATDFPIRRWTSTRIFMLSKIAGYTFTLRY
jgi:hypothetical protein